MAALLLSRSEITALLDVPSVLGILRRGFTEATEIQPLRIRTDLPGPGTATALLPGLIPGVPAYTVKVNAKFPGASPALRGLVCLHDLADGGLLAVLDSASVTAWRTGLAAALATDVLAAADASSVSVIGAGAQAAMVLRGLAALRPLTRLTVYDVDTTRTSGFAQELGISTYTAESPQEAAARGEVHGRRTVRPLNTRLLPFWRRCGGNAFEHVPVARIYG
jgi:ornithine cyclodeaminase